jgi:hypothetical protein
VQNFQTAAFNPRVTLEVKRTSLLAVVPVRVALPPNKLWQLMLPGWLTFLAEKAHSPLPGGVAAMAAVVTPRSPGYVTVIPTLESTR